MQARILVPAANQDQLGGCGRKIWQKNGGDDGVGHQWFSWGGI